MSDVLVTEQNFGGANRPQVEQHWPLMDPYTANAVLSSLPPDLDLHANTIGCPVSWSALLTNMTKEEREKLA
jgi:hypothetical protein